MQAILTKAQPILFGSGAVSAIVAVGSLGMLEIAIPETHDARVWSAAFLGAIGLAVVTMVGLFLREGLMRIVKAFENFLGVQAEKLVGLRPQSEMDEIHQALKKDLEGLAKAIAEASQTNERAATATLHAFELLETKLKGEIALVRQETQGLRALINT